MRKIIKKPDYHDYVFKDDKFIRAFEKMYQNIEDPWNHGKANAIHYDIALFLLKCYKICRREGIILDIGCGKGAFTARLSKTLLKKSGSLVLIPVLLQFRRQKRIMSILALTSVFAISLINIKNCLLGITV